MATQILSCDKADWPGPARRAGWTPEEFDLAGHSWSLGAREIGLLEEIAVRARQQGIEAQTATREQLYHPDLERFFAPASQKLRHGQGIAFLENLPVTGRDLEEAALIYRATGLYFGDAVSQNWKGDMVGYVQAVGGAAEGRAYASAGALRQHSDRIDILSLCCIRPAREGGESTFSSSLLLWDRIAAERPDLLEILKTGFPQFRNGEQAEGDPAVTPYRVPIFGEKDGLRSCLLSANANPQYIEKFGELTLDDREIEALRLLTRHNSDPALIMTRQLLPGEAVFLNNYEVTHGRTAFEDDGGPEGRLLLRLWLEGGPPRPRPAEQTVTVNRSGHQGIDPRSGPPTR